MYFNYNFDMERHLSLLDTRVQIANFTMKLKVARH